MKAILSWLWQKRMARTMKLRLAIYRRDFKSGSTRHTVSPATGR